MTPGAIVLRAIRFVALVVGTAFVVGAIGLLTSLIFLPVVAAGDVAVSTVEDELFDRPPLPDELPVAAEISTVFAHDGERIADLSGPVRREPVAIEEIPEVVIDAVLATEDDEFFEHRGVNHQSMLRAAGRNLAAGGIIEGASTITQQYVRLALLSPEQTIDRKLHEIVWAIELEKRYSKEEILEGYLNGVYLGKGVYGFGTAADYYYSKAIGELTIAEAATLAGTIRAPAVSNPVDNPEAAEARRDIVIRQMLDQGRITEEQAEEALASELELQINEPEVTEPFWIDAVKRVMYDPSADLQPGLQEAIGDTRQERIEALFEGGLQIHTTLDRAMHEHAAQTLASYLTDPVEDPLGAVISIEHSTGAVKTFAIGPRAFGECPADPDEPCEATQINPTVPWGGGSGRQPGSAFKPFVAARALADGLGEEHEEWEERQEGDDDASDDEDEGEEGEEGEEADEDEDGSPLVYEAPSGEEVEECGYNEPYEPHNFENRDFDEIDLTEALRRSVNTYFVKLGRDVGISRVAEFAQAHGVVNSPNLGDFTDLDCSLALGTAEVFPLEMVVAYGVWANGGVRCAPYLVEKVVDRDGNVLYEHEPDCERVVDEDLAAEMRDLLSGPPNDGGTSPVVGRQVEDPIGKTGTTNNFVDAWFVGAAGEYATAAWVGFEHPRSMTDITIGDRHYEKVTGGSLPGPIWADFMQEFD